MHVEKFYMVTCSTLPMQMGFASEVQGWSVIVIPMRSMAALRGCCNNTDFEGWGCRTGL
jgi:hypothetical protein